MSADLLPPVPAGQNPYTAYYAALQHEFYRDPGSGFRARMIVLFILNGIVILAAMVYLGLLVLENKRKGGKLWLFRFVQRPSGRYIATNPNLITSVLAILSGAVILGRLQDSWFVYLYQSSQAESIAWRSFCYIPLVLHAWLVSWALLQAFLLTPDQHDSHLLSARVANTLFLGVGSVLAIALLTSGVFGTLSGQELWKSYVDLRAELLAREAQWGGEAITIAALLSLSPLFASLTSTAAKYRNASLAQAGILCTIPVLTVFVNLGSLGLARVLRRQLHYNFDQFRRPSMLTESTNATTDSDDQSKKPITGRFRQLSRDSQPTRSQIRQLASAPESGVEGEQAKRIMVLQKAERDLVLISSCLVLVAGAAGVICLWVTIVVGRGDFQSSTSWAAYELALFGVEWIYALVLTPTLIFLSLNAATHLSKSHETLPETTYVGGTSSVMSLRGMLGGGGGEATGSPATFGGYQGPKVGTFAAPFPVRKHSTPPGSASISFGKDVAPRR